jgi:hypothetical protein
MNFDYLILFFALLYATLHVSQTLLSTEDNSQSLFRILDYGSSKFDYGNQGNLNIHAVV